MISGIHIGQGLIQKSKEFRWHPNEKENANPHLLVTGMSGSGKTSIILNTAKDLIALGRSEGKLITIMLLDLHGDMYTEGENHIEYTVRNSQYGINPFEFERDEKNGGPVLGVLNIVQMFKADFWPQMGPLQEAVFKNLLLDTYRYKGILDSNPKTWPNDEESEKLPTMKDLYKVFLMIKHLQEGDEDAGNRFMKISSELYSYRQKHNASDVDKTKQKHADSIKERKKEFDSLYEKFYNYVFENSSDDEVIDGHLEQYGIDISEYENKKTRGILENLEPYIKEFSELTIFNESVPKIIPGAINRFDISGFTNMAKPEIALFFAKNWALRIFRKLKMQGLSNRTKIFIVMDESRIVLPSGKEKSNPYHILNKIALEARKYGLGLIMGSQRVSHFSPDLLTSFYTKIILRTDATDVKSTAALLGITKRDIGYFETIDKRQGTGLFIQAGKIHPIDIWRKTEALQ